MKTETLLQLCLVGLFVVLALGEVVSRPMDDKPQDLGDSRLLTNFSLTALALLSGGLLPLARISSSLVSERFGIGLANLAHLPWAAILAAMLLLDSFAAYWMHRLMHVTPVLWRVHRVHHADSALDVSTSLRNHPLELLLTVPTSALVVILVGAPPSVIVVSQTLFIAAALWQHADLRLPPLLDRALSLGIVTPRLHRVHHSPERKLHDSNFGDSITLWDRIFGTFEGKQHRREVGLTGQHARADHLLDQLCSPLFAV